jgi:hypothetical protein
MASYTVRYEPVRTSRTKRGPCPACGKTVTRSRTFENTINPFNKNEDGIVRTRSEVWKRVNAVADEWIPDFRHNKEECQP